MAMWLQKSSGTLGLVVAVCRVPSPQEAEAVIKGFRPVCPPWPRNGCPGPCAGGRLLHCGLLRILNGIVMGPHWRVVLGELSPATQRGQQTPGLAVRTPGFKTSGGFSHLCDSGQLLCFPVPQFPFAYGGGACACACVCAHARACVQVGQCVVRHTPNRPAVSSSPLPLVCKMGS